MANYTQGDTRPVLQPADLTTYQGNGSLVLDSRRTRPLWFDGRFLAARDLAREQNYFLQREADLARSPGFGAIFGLNVNTASSNTPGGGATAVAIQAGRGITPAGEMVAIPRNLTVQLADIVEEQSVDVQFGIAPSPASAPATRTGLYVLALKPVQFTANPITAYPTSVQGSRSMHDGDIVEATAIVLVPYPGPSNNNNPAALQSALARQIFLTGSSGSLPDSLLPLAMISLQGGVIAWLDPYMMRRESGVEFSGLHFGLTDPAAQQAFLLEFDAQLQQVVNSFVRQKQPARFAAADYFQALPPAGRFPLASVSTDGFTQLFFPPQMDVRLSIVPDDELPALIEDSMSLPPIDLTLDPAAYANLTVFALVPVARAGFAALAARLPAVQVTTILPQVLNNRKPLDLLQLYRGVNGIVRPSGTDNSSWQTAFGTQTYGYFIRRRSSAAPVSVQVPPPPATITSLSPASVAAGSPAFTLAINGANFTNEMAVSWNATPLSATFVNPGLLQAQVPASLVAQLGSATIVARDQFQPSNAVRFTIGPPLVLSSISPTNAVAGSAALNLTVTGSGFSSAVKVTWNGTALTTTFVSATQLTAAVPASLIASAGTASVGVTSSTQASPAAISFTIAAKLTITSLSPTSATAGGGAFALTVNGTGFDTRTTVSWNGSALITTFVSATQLTAAVPASLIASAGTASVSATSSTQASPPALSFTIAVKLTIASISPTSTTAGGAAFTLTVNGTGFDNQTTVSWNGIALTTTFVSATQLTAAVPASLIASAGTASVSLTSSTQTSPAAVPFTIAAKLTVTSLSPTSATSGGGAFTLTINGTGFDSQTTASWNGTALTSTQVSATQLTAAVPATLIAQQGSASIGLRNASQTSNTAAFTINPAPPAITGISPNTAVSGGQAITLTVTGSGFAAGAIVTWNGTQLTTTFVSATQLTATVPANLLASAGTAAVAVSMLGQTSPTVAFTITQAFLITSVAPSPIPVGTATITVNGAGFTTATQILWNTTPLTAKFVSLSQMTAAVIPSLLGVGAAISITAKNGNVTSNAITLPVAASTTGTTGTTGTTLKTTLPLATDLLKPE